MKVFGAGAPSNPITHAVQGLGALDWAIAALVLAVLIVAVILQVVSVKRDLRSLRDAEQRDPSDVDRLTQDDRKAA
jgi:hypothetical protein